jgi:inner membrane protein
MEPITHFLTGAAMGRAGLNRKTAYATVAAALAAEAADIDILWSLAGPVESLKHHRGITHTFLAAPLVAAAVVGLVWLWDRWRPSFPPFFAKGAKKDGAPGKNSLRQPIHWGWLYATTLLAALSHLLLDWTNNYGLRPFFPFNGRWYAGSFVFIAEPVLWALFALAFLMPWLLGLADAEIGARRSSFRGQGWAIFALLGMVLLWCWRWTAHAQAEDLVRQAGIANAPIQRIAIEPYPVNPFRWHAIVETPDFYRFAEVNTRSEEVHSDDHADLLYKPAVTPSVEVAKRSGLGQVYLDWSNWAVLRDLGSVPVKGFETPQLPPGRTWTSVQFTDLRFSYNFLGQPGLVERAPLTGWVFVVDGREVAAEGMGHTEQH